MIKLIKHKPLLTIAFVALALLLPNLSALEVSIMEARNFITAREMLSDSNWILTTFNGEPRYQKPPLPTWITAFFGWIFGLKNVWALRLPSALMVMFLGMGVYTLSRKLNLNKSHSLINGLISVTSLYVVLIVFEAPWDIYAHTFMLYGVLFLIKWLKNDGKNSINISLSILFIACSILSKGPVSLYALLLSFLIAYGIVNRDAFKVSKIFKLFGILVVAIALGSSWYIYVRYADPESFARITSREAGNWTSYNVRPFYYYWSFFVQSGIWTLPAFIGLIYPYLKSKINIPKTYKLTFFWTLIAVGLLSIIPEKKSRYLMPVLIPLAMNTGFCINYWIKTFPTMKSWKEKVPIYFHFGLIALCFIVALPSLVYYKLDFSIKGSVLLFIAYGSILVLGILLIRTLLKRDIFKSVLFTIMGIIILSIGWLKVNSIVKKQEVYQRSVDINGRRTITDFQELKDEQLPIYSYNASPPLVIWEYGEKLPRIKKRNVIKFPKEEKFLVLELLDSTAAFKKDFKDYTIQEYHIFDLNKVKPSDSEYRQRRKAQVYLVERLTDGS